MRKMSFLLAALAAGAVLTGCGNRNAETEVQTEVQTEAVTETEKETETEKQTEKQTETETEKESSVNKTRSLIGLVKSSDTSKLTIQTARGKELSFTVTDADIQVAGGIVNGSNVKILYKGTISDTDTSSARVLMVRDIDEEETPVTEGELMTEAEEADPTAGAGSMEGTLDELSTQRIVIRGNDGDAFYFSTYGADVNLNNGLQEGNYVTVYYTGDIYGPDIVAASEITDNGDGEDKAPYGPNPEGEYVYINGSMIDCELGSVTIVTDDGEELTFEVGDASFGLYNGLIYGDYITLECDGELNGTDTSGLKVLAVYDYEDSLSYSYEEEYYDDEYYDESYEEEYYDESYDEYSDQSYDEGYYEE